MKSTLNFMIGFPCSGKSTYINLNLNKPRLGTTEFPVVVSSDLYVEDAAKTLGVTYAEAFPLTIKEATKWAKDRTKFAIDNSLDVIWDQTNLNRAVRVQRLAQFSDKIYLKIGYLFEPAEPQVLYDRMKKLRPEKMVPFHVLATMYKGYEAPSLDEGFDRIVTVKVDFSGG